MAAAAVVAVVVDNHIINALVKCVDPQMNQLIMKVKFETKTNLTHAIDDESKIILWVSYNNKMYFTCITQVVKSYGKVANKYYWNHFFWYILHTY